MATVQNFPFAAIMLYLAGGVTCCVLKPKASKVVCLLLNSLVTVLMFAVLLYTMRTGESYVYWMGHFPAPWGNEVVSLLMVAMLALIFTNDLFTAYVFVEINTIASCALVMLKYRSGRALVATTRYMMMSLLGSGLFLLGIVILYSITGHLLMEPMARKIRELFSTGNYAFPLTVTVGLFAVGMALKSALWPFSAWLPDAHSSATASSSGILSGLVVKSYIILLLKIFYRVIGIDLVYSSGITDILFLFGFGAIVFGSFYALREKDMKRMLAYSSVAQIGYIYLGIGIGTSLGAKAACIQILVHAITKPLLFCTAGAFMSASGGSRRFENLRGAGRRDLLSGIAFTIGALSMIGIPLFAGFITKLHLTRSLFLFGTWKFWFGIAALVISTVLNTLYYLAAVSVLFQKVPGDSPPVERPSASLSYRCSVIIFSVLNLLYGIFSEPVTQIIQSGLSLFS